MNQKATAAKARAVFRYLAGSLGSTGMLLASALLLLPTGRAARCVVQWQGALADATWAYCVALMSLLLLIWAHNSPKSAKYGGVDYTTFGLLILGGLLLSPMAILATAADDEGVAIRTACGLSTWSAFGTVLTAFFPLLTGLLVVVLARIGGIPVWVRLVSPIAIFTALWWLNSSLIAQLSSPEIVQLP